MQRQGTSSGAPAAQEHDPALPQERRYHDAVVPPSVIAGLLQQAGERRIDPAPWFRGLGISAAHCEVATTRISYRQAAEIIRRALASLPGEPLGLHVGTRDPLVSFGVLGFAMMSCRTVGEALAIGLEHHQAAGSLVDVSTDVRDGRVVVRVHERFPDPSLLPFLCEEAFASMILVTRAIVGRSLSPLSVELAYPAPSYAAAYRRIFNCEVHFDSDANRLAIDAGVLAAPVRRHDPANLAVALAACREQLIGTAATNDLVATVERLLREAHGERPSAAEVAERLHISVRGLRRQLAASDETFTSIRNRVLEQRARAMLSDPRRPSVAAVADDLGFSDSREFRRAFRRWTGIAPSDARSGARRTADGGERA